MQHHHTGARARSAHIRSSHDYEGTQLEEMRLRTVAMDEAQASRAPGRRSRLSALVARMRMPSFSPEHTEEVQGRPAPGEIRYRRFDRHAHEM
jgi:hypothetical protein